MTRTDVLKRLDKGWSAFRESYAGLSQADLMEPGVAGAWSVRDILAHVTTWEEEALKYLPVIISGGKTPRYSVAYGGIDAFNAQATERKRDLSLSEVLRELDETHRRIVDLIASTPEAQLVSDSRFLRRLRSDTYGHYPKHTKAITEWRERRSDVP